MRLGDACTIKIGQPIAKIRIDRNVSNARGQVVPVLMPKAMGEDGISLDDVEGVEISSFNEDLLTCPGDVVMKLSTAYETAYIDSSSSGLLVSSFFALLRKRESDVNMQYLAAYLNAAGVRSRLKNLATGQSTIQVLKKRDIADIAFPLPSREDQSRIAAVSQNVAKRRKLLLDMMEKDRLLVESELSLIVRKTESPDIERGVSDDC